MRAIFCLLDGCSTGYIIILICREPDTEHLFFEDLTWHIVAERGSESNALLSCRAC